jgi:hypothetical protein
MLALADSAFYVYAVVGLFIAFGLVRLGHAILDLLRDLDEYRAGRR